MIKRTTLSIGLIPLLAFGQLGRQVLPPTRAERSKAAIETAGLPMRGRMTLLGWASDYRVNAEVFQTLMNPTDYRVRAMVEISHPTSDEFLSASVDHISKAVAGDGSFHVIGKGYMVKMDGIKSVARLVYFSIDANSNPKGNPSVSLSLKEANGKPIASHSGMMAGTWEQVK